MTQPENAFPESCQDYEEIKFLEKGYFSEVYRAKHKRLEDEFALKVLKPDKQHDPNIVQALREEVEKLKKLKSLGIPNIVYIQDYIECNGNPTIVMEYVEGKTLKQYIETKGKLPPRQALQIIKPICEALQKAHSQKEPIFHGDINPSNIIISDRGPKLIDFGLARVVHYSTSPYSGVSWAPEVRDRKEVGPFTDVYGLGRVFEYMVVDHPPESRLAAVLYKATRSDPSQRYQSVSEFLKELEEAVERSDISGRGRRGRYSGKYWLTLGNENIRDVKEFVEQAEKYWDQASELLYSGELEKWLNFQGDDRLANKAEQIRRKYKDKPLECQRWGLEEFLRAAGSPEPKIDIPHATVNIVGSRKHRTRASTTFEVKNLTRGIAKIEVIPKRRWVQVVPSGVTCEGNNVFFVRHGEPKTIELEVNIYEVKQDSGKRRGIVEVKSGNQRFDIDAKFDLEPETERDMFRKVRWIIKENIQERGYLFYAITAATVVIVFLIGIWLSYAHGYQNGYAYGYREGVSAQYNLHITQSWYAVVDTATAVSHLTPTPTSTPTPNFFKTATSQARIVQATVTALMPLWLFHVKQTATAIAALTPTATPTPTIDIFATQTAQALAVQATVTAQVPLIAATAEKKAYETIFPMMTRLAEQHQEELQIVRTQAFTQGEDSGTKLGIIYTLIAVLVVGGIAGWVLSKQIKRQEAKRVNYIMNIINTEPEKLPSVWRKFYNDEPPRLPPP